VHDPKDKFVIRLSFTVVILLFKSEMEPLQKDVTSMENTPDFANMDSVFHEHKPNLIGEEDSFSTFKRGSWSTNASFRPTYLKRDSFRILSSISKNDDLLKKILPSPIRSNGSNSNIPSVSFSSSPALPFHPSFSNASELRSPWMNSCGSLNPVETSILDRSVTMPPYSGDYDECMPRWKRSKVSFIPSMEPQLPVQSNYTTPDYSYELKESFRPGNTTFPLKSRREKKTETVISVPRAEIGPEKRKKIETFQYRQLCKPKKSSIVDSPYREAFQPPIVLPNNKEKTNTNWNSSIYRNDDESLPARNFFDLTNGTRIPSRFEQSSIQSIPIGPRPSVAFQKLSNHHFEEPFVDSLEILSREERTMNPLYKNTNNATGIELCSSWADICVKRNDRTEMDWAARKDQIEHKLRSLAKFPMSKLNEDINSGRAGSFPFFSQEKTRPNYFEPEYMEAQSEGQQSEAERSSKSIKQQLLEKMYIRDHKPPKILPLLPTQYSRASIQASYVAIKVESFRRSGDDSFPENRFPIELIASRRTYHKFLLAHRFSFGRTEHLISISDGNLSENSFWDYIVSLDSKQCPMPGFHDMSLVTCDVCHRNINPSQVQVVLTCQHSLHEDCCCIVDSNPSCPLCCAIR